jgi:flagellar motility protein MotE (MotC chaperone)
MVTRQPKRKFKLGGLIRKVVLPLAALGALAGAVVWPPSHKIIFEGPLKPTLARIAPLADQLGRPLHFVAQQQTITEKNREIALLNTQVEQARKDLASRDDQIKALQGQANQAQRRGAAAESASSGPAGSTPGNAQTVAATGAGAAPAAAQPPNPDVKRTATVWAQMDPESVAGLAQKLPIDYVVKVLGQMSADQVGQVMEALPPAVAAKITQSQGEAPPANP